VLGAVTGVAGPRRGPVWCPWRARGVPVACPCGAHVVPVWCPWGAYGGDLYWVPVWYIWWGSLLGACGVPEGCLWIARGVPVGGVAFRYLLALWALSLSRASIFTVLPIIDQW
jgi:hypothetical protein